MGLHLILVNNMARVIVLGDSDLIIMGLMSLSKNTLPNIMQIYQHIMNMEKQFKYVSYFQILEGKTNIWH